MLCSDIPEYQRTERNISLKFSTQTKGILKFLGNARKTQAISSGRVTFRLND